MTEKPNRKEFEKQCEEISNKLDDLSDWERKFYLYCLIPKYAKELTTTMQEHKLEEPNDVFIVNGLREMVAQLHMVVGMLGMELF